MKTCVLLFLYSGCSWNQQWNAELNALSSLNSQLNFGSIIDFPFKGNWWNLLLTQIDYVILFCKCECNHDKQDNNEVSYFSWLLKPILPEYSWRASFT